MSWASINLSLLFDSAYPVVLPEPYGFPEPGEGSVLLADCADMAELNAELALAGGRLSQMEGRLQALSIYRCERLAEADAVSVCLSPELLQQMSARGCGMDYCLYVSRWRDTRFRNVMTFQLLTFPQGAPEFELPQDVPWLFDGVHSGQRFVLTPDLDALEAFIQHLAERGTRVPELRIDCFSSGSAVIWMFPVETIVHLAALRGEVDLRIHPAMLLPKTDAVYPLFRYLMRSSLWRSRLTPPTFDEVEEGGDG